MGESGYAATHVYVYVKMKHHARVIMPRQIKLRVSADMLVIHNRRSDFVYSRSLRTVSSWQRAARTPQPAPRSQSQELVKSRTLRMRVFSDVSQSYCSLGPVHSLDGQKTHELSALVNCFHTSRQSIITAPSLSGLHGILKSQLHKPGKTSKACKFTNICK